MLPYCSIDPAIADIIAQRESPHREALKNVVRRIANRHIIIDPLSESSAQDDFGSLFLSKLQDAKVSWFISNEKPGDEYHIFVQRCKKSGYNLKRAMMHLVAVLCDKRVNVIYLLSSTYEYLCETLSRIDSSSIGVSVQSDTMCDADKTPKPRSLGLSGKSLLADLKKKAVVIELMDGDLRISGSISAAEQCAFLISGQWREDNLLGTCVGFNLHAQSRQIFAKRSLKPFAKMFQDVFWFEPHLFNDRTDSKRGYYDPRLERTDFGKAILTLQKEEIQICNMLLCLSGASKSAVKLHVVSAERACPRGLTLDELYSMRSKKVSGQLQRSVVCHHLQKKHQKYTRWHDRFIVFMTRSERPVRSNFVSFVFSAPLIPTKKRLGPGLCGIRCVDDDHILSRENVEAMINLADRQSQKKPIGAHEIP